MNNLEMKFTGQNVSKNTMRIENLLNNSLTFLKAAKYDQNHELDQKGQGLVKDLETWVENYFFETLSPQARSEAQELYFEVYRYFNEIAPQGTYFGAHEGNSSLFGFHIDRDSQFVSPYKEYIELERLSDSYGHKYILAYRYGTDEFVTWALSDNNNPIWGHYFGQNREEARQDLIARSK